MSILIMLGIGVAIFFVLIFLFSMFYVVVEPNKAHVVVQMGSGRQIYSPSRIAVKDQETGEMVERTFKTAYFFVPFVMRRIVVSLENVKHEINNIKLHDSRVAPFKCDTTCWFKIVNPDLAAEKLNVDKDGNIMDSIRETLDASVMGIARAAAMGQEVIELMRDRKTFGSKVLEEVNGDLDEWGVQLVKLEIIDFSDAEDSQVIADHQDRRQAEIKSETRKIVAREEKEAAIEESKATEESQKAQLAADEEVEMRTIKKQEAVAKRNEQARLEVATQQDKANAQKVKADRTLKVGEAQNVADAAEVKADGDARALKKTANGQAEAVKIEADADAEATVKAGKAEADVVEAKGKADAAAVKAKGLAKAEATSKQAEAQKQFQDVSKDIEMAKIAADIKKVQYTAMADSMKNAKINIVSEDMEFMGFGAKEGAGIGALIKNLEDNAGTGMKKFVSAVADSIQKKS